MSDLPNNHSREETSSSNAVAPERHSLEGGNLQDLITDHLDIWTSAIKTKSASGRGSSKKLELVGIIKLRELILELAVRGKLVPQDPNDEPASELLKKVAAEKAKLVEVGKIKGAKSLLEINDGDVIYNPPKGWTWSRMGDLAQFQKGYAFKSKDYLESGLMITKIQNLTDNHLQNAAYISPDKALEFEQFLLSEGDIVMTTVGSWFSAPISAVGRSFLINSLFDNSLLNQNAVRIRPWDQINPMYLYTCVNSSLFKSYLVKEAQGTANQASITQISIKNFSICVPPKREQHRIVAKVDELMALCDQLEAQTEASIDAHQTLVEVLLATLTNVKDAIELNDNWQTISQHFDVLFTTQASIEQLKQTILQLAVMGKLVKQDPKDEPASKLLERIATEKQQLIKDGKIKKQKPLPPITDEEKPFDLPEGWGFERFGNLTSRLGSGSTPRGGQSAYVDKGVIFLRSQNVWNDGLKLDDTAYITDETNEKMYNTQVFPGDVLLNITGASLGRSTIFPEHLNIANVSQHVTIIRLIEQSMGLFVHLGILSPLVQRLVWGRQVGMAIEGLSKKVLELFEFPIPPLAEQHRIVAKVDELMTLCDSLKAHLNQAQTTQLHLTDAIVERAL
ncbi:restriction endonuclease subunit S [Paraglaciecola chathamensis]|uniref:restriction endonuclease subunit S n=1 Tax=Paraglaciecola chathamensis TaxID=368405 RepID=UPI00270C83C5|nr:restriction endonuclease subunit S [Paraglaciecola chathamensis]MDO6559404.1 restriction endonuclease subunit S [Paraglaciecola chathamensis]